VIGVIDTESGNLLSVVKAIEYLGGEVALLSDPDEVASCERVVLPGVGAFGVVMSRLRERGMDAAMDAARLAGTPILGVCLGMQLMARRSYEHGCFDGLGWFEADVVRLSPPDPDMRVPHVGWHDTYHIDDSPMFRGAPQGADFYYVHSFHVVPDDDEVVDAWFDYGSRIVSAIRTENVAATQFHPEKSQTYGLQVLENFLDWDPSC
jgi:glutamine amidotransferase